MSLAGYTITGNLQSSHTPSRDDRPLEELIRRPQWVTWKLQRRHNDPKPTKVPYTPGASIKADSTLPESWGTYAEARADVMAHRVDGIGFVFSEPDPYFGVDLDGCRNPETGEIEPWALEIVERFDTYTEISPSGTGLHIIGRGIHPTPARGEGGKKKAHIECYDRDRYFTMTLNPLPGYSQIRDCGEVLIAWHREVWPPRPVSAGTADPVSLTLEDRDIIERLERQQGKAPALMRGDHREYPSPSEARAALAWLCCFYTDDEAQVARILEASGLFREGTTIEERERRARQDAKKGLDTYTGPRYTPSGPGSLIIRPRMTAPAPAPSPIEPQTIEELRAELEASRAREAALHAERDAYRDAFQAVTSIISVESLDASTRLTAIGVLLLGLEFQAKGRKTSKKGDYHMPASWIGRKCGQKPQTVNRQLNRLEKEGLIDRDVRQESWQETVDFVTEDGEIVGEDTYRKRGNKTFIALPENVIDIVPRILAHQKDENAPKRGGARVPSCDKHPDALGVVRRTAYYCEHCCHEAVQAGAPMPAPLAMSRLSRTTRREADEDLRSDIKHERDNTTVDIGDIKPASDQLHIKLERDSEPREGVFAWRDQRPAPPVRKPAGTCIEDGCMNQLSPGQRYYCAAHGGVEVSA